MYTCIDRHFHLGMIFSGLAADKLLTDQQLDSITTGTGGDGA